MHRHTDPVEHIGIGSEEQYQAHIKELEAKVTGALDREKEFVAALDSLRQSLTVYQPIADNCLSNHKDGALDLLRRLWEHRLILRERELWAEIDTFLGNNNQPAGDAQEEVAGDITQDGRLREAHRAFWIRLKSQGQSGLAEEFYRKFDCRALAAESGTEVEP